MKKLRSIEGIIPYLFVILSAVIIAVVDINSVSYAFLTAYTIIASIVLLSFLMSFKKSKNKALVLLISFVLIVVSVVKNPGVAQNNVVLSSAKSTLFYMALSKALLTIGVMLFVFAIEPKLFEMISFLFVKTVLAFVKTMSNAIVKFVKKLFALVSMFFRTLISWIKSQDVTSFILFRKQENISKISESKNKDQLLVNFKKSTCPPFLFF